MPYFIGMVEGPDGVIGQIKLSLNDSAGAGRKIVTGNMRVGQNPTGLTGFSGDWASDGKFSAAGQNRTQQAPDNPFDDVLLSVEVAGQMTGGTVSGTIAAAVNGAPAEWTFEAYDTKTNAKAEALLAASQHVGQSPGASILPEEGGGFMGTVRKVWDRIPTVGKLAAGVVLAGVAGRKLLR